MELFYKTDAQPTYGITSDDDQRALDTQVCALGVYICVYVRLCICACVYEVIGGVCMRHMWDQLVSYLFPSLSNQYTHSQHPYHTPSPYYPLSKYAHKYTHKCIHIYIPIYPQLLPFQAYGALGMARENDDVDTASSDFFFLKWRQVRVCIYTYACYIICVCVSVWI